jgi:hypothetical protein
LVEEIGFVSSGCLNQIPHRLFKRGDGGGASFKTLLGASPAISERLGGEFAATSGWREDFIDQLIVFSVEWIDERDALQRETILQIFRKQVPHARTLCRSP